MMVKKHIFLLLFLWLAGKPAVAQIQDQQLLDSLAGCLHRADNDSSRVSVLLRLLRVYILYKTEEGFQYEQQACDLAESLGVKREAAQLKSCIGRMYWRRGNFETALRYHNEALKIYETLDDKSGIALITTYIGQDYADDGKYTEALQNFERAKQMYESLGNLGDVGNMYLLLAFIYGSQGNYDKAAKENFNALAAFEKTGDEVGVAVATSAIGDAYMQIGNYPEALNFYNQANILQKRPDDRSNRSGTLTSIASIYCKLKNYPEALANLDTALTLARSIGDQFCMASAYTGIANTWNLQGKPAQALPNYQQAAAHFQNISNKRELASVFAQIGICQVQLKNYAEAKPAFDRAEAIAQNLDSKIPLADLYRGMEMLDSATGNWKGAYSNHKLYISLRDSIFNQESARKIMLSQLQYEFDKKELIARVEQEKRDNERRNTMAIVIGTALLFCALVFFQLKIRRDRSNAETKRLRDLNEAKSQFLSTVSHELRTPLTSILGFSKIIKKRLEERVLPDTNLTNPKTERAVAQVMDNLDIVVNESERLTLLINEVLDLAKIESGKIVWHEEMVDMTEIADRAMAATASLFEQKGLELRKNIEADLPRTLADPDRLQQVMVNLLSNAVKFTDSGAVTCIARRQGQHTLLIGVADTGMGIPEDAHGLIFEKFGQVSSDTLTDKPQGTGLGLPICKEIIEHYGGRLWVESEPGKGSTFFFSLPIVAESKQRTDLSK